MTTIDKLTKTPAPNTVYETVNKLIDAVNQGGGGGGGTVTDVQINGASITSSNVANIVTNSAYNSSTNKIATMSDVRSRNIGEIVQSTIPLSDAGLHLLDGSVLQYGSYKAFIDYIAHLYNRDGLLYNLLSPVTNIPILQPVFRSNTEDGITVSDARGNTTVLQDILNGSSVGKQVGHWNTYWIQFDYGRPVCLASYKIQADMAGSQESPTAWSIQGSNDGTTWTTICSETVTSSFWGPGTVGVFDTNSADEYNIFRIVFSAGTESSNNGELKKLTFEAYEMGAKVLFCTEEQWQASVSTYGVCGKFVYDSTNNTVRLPKIKGFTEGTYITNNVARITRSGLPNIEGTIAISEWDKVSSSITGAFNNIKKLNSKGEQGDDYGNNHSVSFDANIGATSTGIYGNSNTVQPQSLKVLYYIVVANTIKTEIEVDIDEIVTDLNSKADKDLSNLVPTSSTNFDGQWVQKNLSVSTTKSVGSREHDLSDYLPNDNYSYEVIFGLVGSTGTNSCGLTVGTVASPSDNSSNCISGVIYASTNARQARNFIILPIDTTRKVYTQITSNAFSGLSVTALGYRRIGTNN